MSFSLILHLLERVEVRAGSRSWLQWNVQRSFIFDSRKTSRVVQRDLPLVEGWQIAESLLCIGLRQHLLERKRAGTFTSVHLAPFIETVNMDGLRYLFPSTKTGPAENELINAHWVDSSKARLHNELRIRGARIAVQKLNDRSRREQDIPFVWFSTSEISVLIASLQSKQDAHWKEAGERAEVAAALEGYRVLFAALALETYRCLISFL